MSTFYNFEDGSVPEGWTTPADADTGWIIDDIFAFDGGYSLRSGPITHGQVAAIEATFDCEEITFENRIQFRLRTSTEPTHDAFKFYIDDELIYSRSGENGFVLLEHPGPFDSIPAGLHTLRFEYAKNSSVSGGDDVVHIDALTVPGTIVTGSSLQGLLLIEAIIDGLFEWPLFASTVHVVCEVSDEFTFIAGQLPRLIANGFALGTNPLSVPICQVKDLNRLQLRKLMQDGGLRAAERRVNTYYDLWGDGEQSLEIKMLYDEPSGMIEYIQKTTRNGQVHYILGIDMVDYFPPMKIVNGWDVRRVLAHEMVHVLMYENVPLYADSCPLWFIEGQAELIHGANSRLANDLKNRTEYQLLQYLDIESYSEPNANLVYSAGYVGVRYLHELLKPVGLKAFLVELKSGKTFSESLATTTVFSNEADFRDMLKQSYGYGVSFLGQIIASGQLNHPDTGAIGGYWVDGGPILTNETVMNDG